MVKIDLPCEVLLCDQMPEVWGVEAIDADGGVYVARFSGPAAKEAALEYAAEKFGSMVVTHLSDCAVHNGPAYPAGTCDCGIVTDPPK